MTYDTLVHNFLIFCIAVLAVTVFLCLIRTLIGPRISDRIVGVNMIGTQVIIMVVLIAVLLGEEGLADISLLYAVLSFLSVVVITKIYTNVYQERMRKRERKIVRKKKGEQGES